MKVVISNHAIYRINEREISSHDVRKIAKNGNIIKENNDGSLIKRGKSFNGRNLTVIVKCYNTDVVVITTYYEN